MAPPATTRPLFIGRFGESGDGIPIGCQTAVFTPRQRDRRHGLMNLFVALTRALDRDADISLMRGAFEQMVQRMVPVRTIRLRDNSRWSNRADDRAGSESVTLDVPGPDVATKAVLEATFDPACGLGDWDFQLLGLSAHIAALVLEIERSRLRIVRAAILDGTRHRREGAASLIGSTPPMLALRATIDRVAATDFVILLEGESGVGKELVARQIHERSRRRHGPFVAVNCAAIVETLLEAELFGIEERTATGVRGRKGKFEQAENGTLFLDEVSDLSLSAQAKLLRAIQDLSVERVGGSGSHRVNIRVVAATNRSLSGLVDRRLFRSDLYYRLSGVDIRIPPLRERRGDVLVLAEHFLETHRLPRRLRLSRAATDALFTYDWPGNVRELQRMIERAVALAETDTIELDDLPKVVRGGYSDAIAPSIVHNDTLRTWASRYARLIFERCHGNKREACRVLGISYHTLQSYLRMKLEPDAGEAIPQEPPSTSTDEATPDEDRLEVEA
jgi:DNA-binding NtrC family response regulator